jgi:hypothetical protein
MAQRMFAGQTKPGATAWQQYSGFDGVFVDVDTTGGNFSNTPIYLASIGGRQSHWATTGGSSIYFPTARGFRVYLQWADGGLMTPNDIAGFGWHVNWIGIEMTNPTE